MKKNITGTLTQAHVDAIMDRNPQWVPWTTFVTSRIDGRHDRRERHRDPHPLAIDQEKKMKTAYFKETMMAEGETAEEAIANAIEEARHAGIIDDNANSDEEAYPRVTFETFWNELSIQ